MLETDVMNSVIRVISAASALVIASACSSSSSSGNSAGQNSGGAAGAGNVSTGGANGDGICSPVAEIKLTSNDKDCPAAEACARTNCSAQYEACYGVGFEAGDYTGGACEDYLNIFKHCACDATCLTHADLYDSFMGACSICIRDQAMKCAVDQCQNEFDACAAGAGGSSSTAATGGAASAGGSPLGATGGRSTAGGAGGNQATGGVSAFDGTSGGASAIGNTSTGGAPSSGGAPATGGIPSSGGAVAATGGTLAAGGSGGYSCSGLSVPVATVSGNLTVTNQYVTAGTLKGYGFAWLGDGSNATTCIVPTCGTTGCSPNFSTAALCAAGIVGADASSVSIAGVGFNLNQSTAGSTSNISALTDVTVTVAKATGAGDAAARIQLVSTTGTSSTVYCVEAGQWATGVPIPIGQFNTKCADGSGTALTAGTPITSLDVVIPADAAISRPFSFCLSGVVFG